MAWVWDPDALGRSRGFATARLFVYLRELRVFPTRLGRLLGAAPDLIGYTWPAVVIERHQPVPEVGILVDINGKLGRVAVRGGSQGRLRHALEAAEFEVIEVTHTGWEAPKPVALNDLAGADDRVPPCVVAR
jgi:hypothetical protein